MKALFILFFVASLLFFSCRAKHATNGEGPALTRSADAVGGETSTALAPFTTFGGLYGDCTIQNGYATGYITNRTGDTATVSGTIRFGFLDNYGHLASYVDRTIYSVYLSNGARTRVEEVAAPSGIQSCILMIDDLIRPSKPRNLKASNITANAMQLTWQAGTDGSERTTRYVIRYLNGRVTPSRNCTEGVGVDVGLSTTRNLQGLQKGQFYTIYVCSTGPSGAQVGSDAIQVATLADPSLKLLQNRLIRMVWIA